VPALLFLLAGVCLVIGIWPRATWMATAGWQFKNPEGAELKPSMYVVRSVSGVVGALMLAGGGIWLLVTEDERACEAMMRDLEISARGADFDRSSLAEINDDFDASWDLNRTAAILEVDLRERDDHSVEVVDEEGDVLGTLDEDGAHPDCG